jgi:hypothetical protein
MPHENAFGLVGKFKEPGKVNVFGGISRSGVTNLLVFEGKMDGTGFVRLCGEFLIPFINETFPNFHILHMDNAPQHTTADQFFQTNNINHRPAPAQSPDMNPIELVWHDLKVWLTNVWLPRNRAELLIGIQVFWRDVVTMDYCISKIDHIERVIHKVIQLNGKATGL